MPQHIDTFHFNFQYYKSLAERALDQLTDDAQLHWRPDDDANSIAIIVKHIAGNLASRWTDFLHADGEKPWRDRDNEFLPPDDLDALHARWNAAWNTLFQTLDQLTDDELHRTITIRSKEHTVTEALQRSLAHTAYHVGQIVFIARMQLGPDDWQSLSIPRGQSSQYRPKGQR